ncbi:pilus assembly PilX family protein [Amphritea balenae]|uniref:Type 4 fimbrial biogenesis protein PilX N-terminal domain-containing protein n=1 Tax=Amphritea balenae TaxID=452629 RepID=A0A3P1SJ60_9GAMM|nr:hypothetical protein EHS89_17640 [Amphritea balenae]GGK83534.1 hypothetical protein GCM10007941_37590 [Amphritea balenae]
MSGVNKITALASQSPEQRGTVLMIALVIVLAMGITAASALQNITLQERMAGNMQDKSIAFHAAEDALIVVENWILNNSAATAVYTKKRPAVLSAYDGIANAEKGKKPLTEQDILDSTQFVNWLAHAYDATDFSELAGNDLLDQQVKVTVELLSPSEYLILAYSSGASGNTEVILRSVVVK